jgi:glutathione S-transferase
MIIFHRFGPAFGLPDPSPFCMKADILLQMSGLPFERVSGDLRKAPKGKLPMIVDDGVTVPDSSFIRLHLEQTHGIDFDQGLSERERGVLWALEKMLEDQLYWVVVRERWTDDSNFERGPATFFKPVPAPLRPLVVAMVKRKIRRNLKGHGIGLHSEAEQLVLARRALGSVAAILSDRPYLGGDAPVGADATLAAFMSAGLCPLFESRVRGAIEEHPALTAYADRMMARFFPDFAAVRAAA